jgi:hypothetical protein
MTSELPIAVRPSRQPGDPSLYDSAEIRTFIQKATLALSKQPYDPETEALPLRTDAFFWTAEYLCGRDRGILFAAGLGLPTVTMEKDGTLSIRFVHGFRSLTLRVLAKKVVFATQTFEDGQTRIDRMLPGEPEWDTLQLETLTGWLLEGPT